MVASKGRRDARRLGVRDRGGRELRELPGGRARGARAAEPQLLAMLGAHLGELASWICGCSGRLRDEKACWRGRASPCGVERSPVFIESRGNVRVSMISCSRSAMPMRGRHPDGAFARPSCTPCSAACATSRRMREARRMRRAGGSLALDGARETARRHRPGRPAPSCTDTTVTRSCTTGRSSAGSARSCTSAGGPGPRVHKLVETATRVTLRRQPGRRRAAAAGRIGEEPRRRSGRGARRGEGRVPRLSRLREGRAARLRLARARTPPPGARMSAGAPRREA